MVRSRTAAGTRWLPLAAAGVLAAGAAWWLLRTEPGDAPTAAPPAADVPAAPPEEAAELPAPPPPPPHDAALPSSSASPVARLLGGGEPAVASPGDGEVGTRTLLVGALTTDGDPLRDALPDASACLEGELSFVATRGPPPRNFQRSLLGARRGGDVGEFKRAHTKVRNESAPGHLGTLTVPDEPGLHVALVAGESVIAARPLEAGEDNVWFEVDAARDVPACGDLRLRVVAAKDGTPLPDAKVRMGAGLFIGFLNPGGLAPDEDGVVEASDLVPGATMLSFEHPGFARRVVRVRIPTGKGLDLGDVALDLASDLDVRVVDEAGAFVGATVLAVPLAADGGFDLVDIATVFGGPSAALALAGSSRIEGLGRARYLLVAADDDEARGDGRPMMGWRVVDLSVEPRPDAVEIACRRATEVRLLKPPGTPPAFSVTDAASGVRMDVHVEFAGEMDLCPLPPGTYTFTVHGAQGPRERTVQVGEAPVTVSLDG